MPDNGWTDNKFKVNRTDGLDGPDGPKRFARYFVLDYAQDQHAQVALAAYAESCRGSKPELARDIEEKLASVHKVRTGLNLLGLAYWKCTTCSITITGITGEDSLRQLNWTHMSCVDDGLSDSFRLIFAPKAGEEG